MTHLLRRLLGSYDLNGNLATLTDGAGTTTYAWDSRNRLTGLAGPGLTASFSYDALGRRWTKTINGARTDFLYDSLNPVQEGLLPDTPAANLLTSLGLDELFTRTDPVGLRTFLVDALGSTLALVDPTGAAQTEYTYAPFGATTSTGQPSTNSYQFTAREADATSLYHYRARYYHPALQRFITEDPIRWGGGANLYTYVWNSALNLTDPLGLAPFRNNSDRDIPYKPENEDNVIRFCKSGSLCNVDGVYSPPGSERQCAFKIPDNCFASVNRQGQLTLIGDSGRVGATRAPLVTLDGVTPVRGANAPRGAVAPKQRMPRTPRPGRLVFESSPVAIADRG